MAIENNGYHGSYPEIILKAIGQSGRFTSVKWSATGGYYLLYVVGGDIQADFDALSLAGGGDGDGTVPDWAFTVPWSLDTAKAACLTLMTDVMDLTIEQSWFTTPRRTTVIPEFEQT